MNRLRNLLPLIIFLLFVLAIISQSCKQSENKNTLAERWSEERINQWYDDTPYLVGANYVPSSAINQLEMWQEDSFDPDRINFELDKASNIGMSTMRVFLHDLAWKQDPEGFFQRVDKYLEIAEKNGIYTMFVIFDGVWNPYPKSGKQPDPVPHVHNSGWVQSPGRAILEDPQKQDELKEYVQAVVNRYKNDKRVLIWDLFNEPDNANSGNFGGDSDQPDLNKKLKKEKATQLLNKTFDWIREIDPSQPLTAGVWGKPTWLENPDSIEKISLQRSDILSFHSYMGPEDTRKMVMGLKKYNRPLLCTEYMARSVGSTFENILPILHENRVGAYNWGLFNGKSQTIYPWSSWKNKFTEEPTPWFHDVFRKNGQPYSKKEASIIKAHANRPFTEYENTPTVHKPMPSEEIESGLKSRDKALFVKDGWIRDPFIYKGPDDYFYLTGTTPMPGDPTGEKDPYNIGLGPESCVGWKAHMWRSKDFINWEPLGTPYDLYDGIWAEAYPERFDTIDQSGWHLWAPEIHWLGDRWGLVHTSPSPVAAANFSLSDGNNLNGEWVNPMGTKIGKRHDPSLFQDDDGTWWMIWGATQIAPLKDDFSGFSSEPVEIGPSGATKKMGHEGCLIHKIGDTYVLFGTGWSTGKMRKGSYNLYYATSNKITGPYSERKFVGRFLGHGTPFKDNNGDWWCTAFYNANNPPLDSEGIENVNLAYSAYTINKRGTTLVPLEIYFNEKDKLIIRAIPSEYRTPGPDEAQQFNFE